MFAATDRREIRPRDGDLYRLATHTPRPVFRAAYRELCTRLWIELELLAQATEPVDSSPPPDLLMSTVILRLELIVLIDSCRSPHWRRMLSAEQRDSLCSMLTDSLAALYVDAEHLYTGILQAQDRILDELLPETPAKPSQPDPPAPHEPGQGPHTAIHELVTLIEAQAAARAVQ